MLYINNSYDSSWQLLMYLLIFYLSITVWDTIILGSVFAHGFEIPLHLGTSLRPWVLFWTCHIIELSTQKFCSGKIFFNGGVNVEIKFYIFKSFGPHGGGELSYQHMIAQLVYQRHYLGNFGPITLTLCWFTEGSSLQHFIWKFYNFLQDLWIPSAVKDNMIIQFCVLTRS